MRKADATPRLAALLDEASRLTDEDLAECDATLEAALANEFEVARVSPIHFRLFVLARKKRKHMIACSLEAKRLSQKRKHRESAEILAEGMRASREADYLQDTFFSEIEIAGNTWRYGAIDSLVVRKGPVIVTSHLDGSMIEEVGSGSSDPDDPDDDSPDGDDIDPTQLAQGKDHTPDPETRH